MTKKNNVIMWQIISAVLLVALIASIATDGFKFEGSTDPEGSDEIGDLIGGNAIKGDPDAPVTIVEWSDYECPFCGKFYFDTLWQIEREYVETGKVNLVYRDFPLGFHAQAQKAAEAAECAGEQDKYYEMHDRLFESGVGGGVIAFKQYAVDLELDVSAFNECLDSDAMASEVKADMQAGVSAGVQGTPGFIINGKPISGAQPYSVFKQAIEEALN